MSTMASRAVNEVRADFVMHVTGRPDLREVEERTRSRAAVDA